GFGDLATTTIDPTDSRALQENLLVSHAAGVGQPFARDVVRAMLLLRANTLALGHSGCRPLLVDALLALLDAGIHPVVPDQGSVGALLLADADRLTRTATVAAAMSVEALLGTDVAFAAPYQLARPHPGQVTVAAELRHLLRDSTIQTGHHGRQHKVQDPYSLRCVPQVHGAVRDALDYLRRVLDVGLNPATDY